MADPESYGRQAMLVRQDAEAADEVAHCIEKPTPVGGVYVVLK
jgi:hypothetical protein